MRSVLRSFWQNRIKFIPVYIFTFFIVLLTAAQIAMNSNGLCNFVACSSIDVGSHIMGKSVDIFDDKQVLRSECVRTDKDGKIVRCEGQTPPCAKSQVEAKSDDAKTNSAPSPSSSGSPATPAPAPCYPSDILARRMASDRFSRQIIWMFFICLNIFLGTIGLIIYVLITLKYVQPKYILICGMICLAFGIVISLPDSPVIEPVITATIAPDKAGETPVGDNVVKSSIERTVECIVRIVNALFYTLAFATSFVMAAVLFGPRKTERDKKFVRGRNLVKESSKTLLKQVSDLRVILYISVALLIAGMLRMSSVLSWAVSFLPTEEGAAAAAFFGHFTFVVGASYTVLVAAMYLPAYFYLKSTATELVKYKDISDEEVLQGFKSEFFQFSPGTSIPHIIAIAAPFLTGASAELFVSLLPK
jgi:hypothetical protein